MATAGSFGWTPWWLLSHSTLLILSLGRASHFMDLVSLNRHSHRSGTEIGLPRSSINLEDIMGTWIHHRRRRPMRPFRRSGNAATAQADIPRLGCTNALAAGVVVHFECLHFRHDLTLFCQGMATD